MVFNIKFKNTSILSLLVIFALSPFILSEAKINSNLVPNGTFEENLDGWNADPGLIFRNSTDAAVGSYCLQMNSVYIESFSNERTFLTYSAIPIVADSYHNFSFHLKSDGLASVRPYIAWRLDGVWVAANQLHGGYSGSVWTNISGSVLSPSGCNEALFYFEGPIQASPYNWSLDEVILDNPAIPELTTTILIPTIVFLFGSILGLIKLKSRDKIL